MSKRTIIILAVALAIGSPSEAASLQEEATDTRIENGDILVCVPNQKGGWHLEEGFGLGYSPGLANRMESEFRARYNVSDRPGPGGTSPAVSLAILEHALPLFEQTDFPDAIGPSSLVFLRTELRVVMLFQLDPWNNGRAGFTWVERRHGESFVARGLCTLEP